LGYGWHGLLTEGIPQCAFYGFPFLLPDPFILRHNGAAHIVKTFIESSLVAQSYRRSHCRKAREVILPQFLGKRSINDVSGHRRFV
jgi:hypothetical protein